MGKRKLREKLERSFGSVPDPMYFSGDMDHIRAYYDFRRDDRRDDFLIDDTTWHDLDMDSLFQRINPHLSTSGEQYLYYMLRSPQTDAGAYTRRRELISLMETRPQLRLRLQMLLHRLGCSRRADLCTAFFPESHGAVWLVVFSVLALLVPAAFILLAVTRAAAFSLLAVTAVTVNLTVHEFVKRRIQKDFDTVDYTAGMIAAMERVRRLHDPDIDGHLGLAYASLDRLRSVVHTGGVAAASDSGGGGDVLVSVLLLDLITYEFLKNKLGRCHEDVFTIHEHLGRLDAAIAVASYRKSLPRYAEPELDFSAARPYIRAAAMAHPLLTEPVTNDLVADTPMLITGSNASGKSTFLKVAALCAIMAQSICTCTAESYTASAMRVYSSMALTDDLMSGESYYIVEIRSLKRILDSLGGKTPVLCVIDEVLRGTNTVERIAASSQVLSAMADSGALCLAATHDIELCALLDGKFTMAHFQETVSEGGMTFDYRVRPGPAQSRNAINLLELLGFDDGIVSAAHDRAARYLDTGVWS